MKYISCAEAAVKWGVSERSVRNYCAGEKIEGAVLSGKTWLIPESAKKPQRSNKSIKNNPLLSILKEQKNGGLKGGIYHKIQIELTYNSNHIEGSMLTHDQTRYIYETNTIGIDDKSVNVDDIIETVNHFRCIDKIIEKSNSVLSESLIKELHLILKTGTADSSKDWFAVGDYKRIPNEVGGTDTAAPEEVHEKIASLLESYNRPGRKTLEDIVAFHVAFERIHPFQDGNGVASRKGISHGYLPDRSGQIQKISRLFQD